MNTMTNRYLFSKIIVGIAVVFLLLTPAVNINAPFFMKSLDVYGALVFFLTFGLFTLHRMKAPVYLLLIITVFLVLIGQMFLLEIIYGHGDYTGISFTARSIVTVVVAYGCTQVLIKIYGDRGCSVFIKLIVFCALLQGAIFWLSFLFPSVREIMSLIFYRDIERGAEHLILLRTPGFVATGGDGLSMNHALLCVVGLIGTYIIAPLGRPRKSIVFMLFISMLGTVFTGRSGLYLGFLFMVTLILIQKNGAFYIRRMYRVLFFVLLFFFVLIFLGSTLGNLGQDLLDEYGYEHPVVRLLRGFISMQDSGSYTDNTVETLLTDMVVLPTDPLHLLFGNNHFGTFSDSNIRTDVGYFRMLYGIGFFGLFIFLTGVFVIPLMHASVRIKNLLSEASDWDDRRALRTLNQLLLIVLMFGLIGHYKIFFLSTRIYLFVFFVFLFFVLHRDKVADRENFKV